MPGVPDSVYQTGLGGSSGGLREQLSEEKRGGRFIWRGVADEDTDAGMSDHLIAYTSLTASRTVSLPSLADVSHGKEYKVKDEADAAGTFAIVVAADGSDTIEGAASTSITSDGGGVSLYAGAVDWRFTP